MPQIKSGKRRKGVAAQIRAPRPKSKADRLQERQQRLLTLNHPDLVEEQNARRKKHLDEGFRPSQEEEDEMDLGGRDEARKIGKKKMRKTAEEQADDLFRDIRGEREDEDEEEEGWDEEDEEEDRKMMMKNKGKRKKMGDEHPDEESEDEEEMFGEDEDRMMMKKGGKRKKIADDEESGRDEDDDEAPPEEHTSRKPMAEEDGKISNLSSSSKKQRKTKKKRVMPQKVADGTYQVDMGGAQFRVVALQRVAGPLGEGEDTDALFSSSAILAPNPKSFRDRLLEQSTRRKRNAKYRMPVGNKQAPLWGRK